MKKEIVTVFDADNTIWDTDGTFRKAQLAMLHTLAESGRIENPDKQLGTLRSIDMQLGKRLGKFEYDFRLLAIALLAYFSNGNSTDAAIQNALAGTFKLNKNLATIVNNAHVSFQQGLRIIPDLFPDTLLVLSSLKEQRENGLPLLPVLFSEGDPFRLERILKAHEIIQNRFFNKIIIQPKNKHTYESLKQNCFIYHNSIKPSDARTRYVMIGDNLERDIKFANEAGFITVYKPSKFKGVEKIHDPIEKPDYKINVLQQILGILNKIYAQHIFDAPKMLI